jgi:amino acid adenylation domain-containing protein/thioester reductase-like protein
MIEGFRLSPQQKRLWQLQQDSSNECYQAQCTILIEGNLDRATLQSAIAQLIQRHEILRTQFQTLPELSLPLQVICDRLQPTICYLDWSALTVEAQYVHLQSLTQELRRSCPNLETMPLLQCVLVTLSSHRSLLLIGLPALCADATTLQNLVQDLSRIYAAYQQGEILTEPPMQYADLAEWQHQLLEAEATEAGRTYWQQQARLPLPQLPLPFEPRSHGSAIEPAIFQPAWVTQEISPALLTRLETLAQAHQTSTEVVLLTCWIILLGRLTEQQNMMVATAYNGRKYEELKSALGLLTRYLPLRCDLTNHPPFCNVLQHVHQIVQEMSQWQEYFDWDTISSLNNQSSSAYFFPFHFEFHSYLDRFSTSDISFSIQHHYACIDRFNLKLSCIRQAESLITEFHYDISRFSEADIQRLANHFQTLLTAAIEQPETPIAELNLLSTAEQHQLLVEFNPSIDPSFLPCCIHDRFQQQVHLTPDHIAAVCDHHSLSYRQLNQLANQLAHHLHQFGVTPNTPIALLCHRSLDWLVAMLAILKAGAAYLPLDPSTPPDRLRSLLQAAQVPLVVTQACWLDAIGDSVPHVVCLDRDGELIAQQSIDHPTSSVTPADLAYLIYTSGSTGQPKAVAVEHQQLAHYLHGILPQLNLPLGASYACVSTLAADLAHTVLFASLTTGGCLHLISHQQATDANALAAYCEQHPIDCLKIVPSHLAALLSAAHPQKLLPRRWLICGGEALSWQLVEQIQGYQPTCEILNHYGPTETTVGVLSNQVSPEGKQPDAATVPLGRSIGDTPVYVLDARLRPVPVGVAGELYVGGASVARGYWQQPELTAERFITHCFVPDEASVRLYRTGDRVRYLANGGIEYLGRMDEQVKVRGYRVELGEIEATLRQHPAVREAVVQVQGEGSQPRLIGYVVPQAGVECRVEELLTFLKQSLPEYMVPALLVPLKVLPLTPNGKLDRRALSALQPDRLEQSASIAPRTPTETQLAEIWTKLLGLQQVSVHDNFFDLGGHSLLITQLLAQVRSTFQMDLSLRQIFEAPTIAELAEIIENSRTGTPPTSVVTVDWKAEVCLDPAIYLLDEPSQTTIAQQTSNPSRIFLTGATGFLGAFLLHELLQQTQAHLYCLVRATDIEAGKQKLRAHLESYGICHADFDSKIIPVIGCLAQPMLGLTESQFQELADQLDVIYHNGAWVNFAYPYATLKATNVWGTQEILRLACCSHTKPVHFISTTSIFSGINHHGIRVIRESDRPADNEVLDGGYAQSKWVAERLVTIAQSRGLPISIYRPGRIGGHSQTGVCNVNDFFYRTVAGCIQIGSVPNTETNLNIAPVDYVSQAIVSLSKQAVSLGKTFHLTNPYPLKLNYLANSIRSLGYPIQEASYESWRSLLVSKAESDSESVIHPLVSLFPESNRESENHSFAELEFDCENTLNGLANTSVTCPAIDDQLLERYLAYLTRKRYIDAPQLSKMHLTA